MPPVPETSFLDGLVAAPFTPFGSDGELALETVPALAAGLKKNGVRGAFVCGTTGEGASLSTAERKRLVESWIKSRPSDLAVIVHVGHNSAVESRELARHAQATGADAIAAIAPSFFKPASVVELTEWCRQVASAAPNLPFYYYHMPAMTGVSIAAAELLEYAGPRIPTLAGVKFTHEDLMDYLRATQVDGGKYPILFGRDEILLAGLAMGARAAVGSTYNFAAPLYQRILGHHAKGDLVAARRDQGQAVRMITILNRYRGLVGGKAIMGMIGLDCGAVRSPLPILSPNQKTALRDELDAIGFFEFASKL